MKYLLLYEWMYTEYHLKDSEQKVYAALLYLCHAQPQTPKGDVLNGDKVRWSRESHAVTMCYNDLIPWTMGMSRDTIVRACQSLVQKGLLSMEKLAYTTYDFHALDPKHLYRRDNYKTEETQQEAVAQNAEVVTQNAEVVTQNAEVVTQNAEVVTQNAEVTPYYSINNNINNNIKNNNNSCSSCYNDASEDAKPQPQQDFLKNGNNPPAEALRPTWEEVMIYAQERMIPMDIVKKFFCYYESNGWKKIKKWKASLQYWVLKERHGRRDNLPAEALRSTVNEDIHRRIIAQQHAQREQAEKDYEAHREENEAARDAFFRRLRAGELTKDLAKKMSEK